MALGGGAEWVEVLVREMMNAANVDDARARASAVLEVFEKSVTGRVATAAAETLQKVVVGLRRQCPSSPCSSSAP